MKFKNWQPKFSDVPTEKKKKEWLILRISECYRQKNRTDNNISSAQTNADTIFRTARKITAQK